MVAQPPQGQYLQPMTQEQWQALLEQHYAGLGMAMPGPAYQANPGNAAQGPGAMRGPQTQQPPPQPNAAPQDGAGNGYMSATTTPSAPSAPANGAWNDPAFLAMRQQQLAQQQGMPIPEPVGGQQPQPSPFMPVPEPVGSTPPGQQSGRQPQPTAPPDNGQRPPPAGPVPPPIQTTQPPPQIMPVPGQGQPAKQYPIYHPWRDMDLATRQYYEDTDPQAAYRQYVGDMYGNQDTPLNQYATQFYQQARARYLQASEQDPNMMWVDSLSPDDLNNYIRSLYGSQTASGRGETLYYAPKGRMTG